MSSGTKTITHQTQTSQQADPQIDLGLLPSWNFDGVYTSIDDTQIEADFKVATEQAQSFETHYKGKLTSLSSAELIEAIAQYEVICETLDKIGSYAQLQHSVALDDTKVGQFYQMVHERYTEIYSHLLFFGLELNECDLDLTDPALAKYAPWIRDARIFKPYQLSHDLEKILHDKNVTSGAAWVRLFNETMAALKFPYEGKDHSSAEIFTYLTDPKREIREKASHVIADVLNKNSKTFCFIYNTLVKDKEIEDRWRGYPAPITSRNKGNLVEDEVVDALLQSVQNAYPRLSHRYFKMKAKWLGLEKLEYWDRNAPLSDVENKKITWDEARTIVLKAYGDFSPQLAELVQQFFDKGWIDAGVHPGKDSGAFSHPFVPSSHPFILMNYQGKVRDVATLAHELGHGIHQCLAADQGHLLSNTPLTLAETASVFGEMLTFQSLVEQESNPEAKKMMIAGKVEDMLNTVVRQIAFCLFERDVHDLRRKQELTVEDFGRIWMEKQKESLGPVFNFQDEYHIFWSYIPHFIHTPFYVYAYAFGDCLVNSLYGCYQNQPEGFEAKYIDMLKAGGINHHKEALAPFGLDARDPEFWNQGLKVIENYIDQLEQL